MVKFKLFVLGICLMIPMVVGVLVRNDFVQGQINSEQEESFPMVLFNAKNTEDLTSDSESRTARNSKFDGWSWVRSTPGRETTEVFLNSDWQLGLSALPVANSSCVVLAEVESGEAFLSGDKTGVYSEFRLKIERVFKTNDQQLLEPESFVTAVRAGGRIQYPSGRVVKYSVRGKDMPKIGRTYAFFLVYDKDLMVYSILTAYEFTNNGKIKALDGKQMTDEGGWPFKDKESLTSEQFSNELEVSVLTDGRM